MICMLCKNLNSNRKIYRNPYFMAPRRKGGYDPIYPDDPYAQLGSRSYVRIFKSRLGGSKFCVLKHRPCDECNLQKRAGSTQKKLFQPNTNIL